MPILKPRRDQLERYPTSTTEFIPLHRYDATTRTKKGRLINVGKRPRDTSWPTRQYDYRKIREAGIEAGFNVGQRLRSDQLVIDVDPRNGGDAGFKKLCEKLSLDPSIYPRVITGSGGSHYHMSKPADLLVLDSLEGFDGVEFKSKKRQVVCAGSIHPETKRFYLWDDNAPKLTEKPPPAPANLLRLIRRPAFTGLKGGGEATQEQIAAALATLDVTEFQDESKWRRLMMACHHASNGDARSEFIEWSITDPRYQDDAEIIGRRWDSCHRDRDDAITYKTLNHFLQKEGDANAQIRLSAANDFEDDLDDYDDAGEFEADDAAEFESDAGEFEAKPKKPKKKELDDGAEPESVYTEAGLSRLEQMNEQFSAVLIGSSFKILAEEFDAQLKRKYWIRLSQIDFNNFFQNERLERDTEKLAKGASPTIGLGQAWLTWPKRKTFRSTAFVPYSDEFGTSPVPEGVLNLWQGYSVSPGEPEGSSWGYMRELIHDVICSNNDALDAYVMNWIAHMLQFPAHQGEVALVFRGGRGVGKGTLGNVLARLIGKHAIALSSATLITGRFNAHLQDVIFLFGDEAIRPFDKQAEAQLKAFITEPALAYEGKGLDVRTGPNFLHIMLATNDAWIIPAGIDERRFVANDVSPKWQGRFDLWDKLHAELANGGLQKMMFDLLNHPLPKNWHPARDMPVTSTLIDQKIRSLLPLQKFLFEICNEGDLPCMVVKGDWQRGPIRMFLTHFRDSYVSWQRENGINPSGGGRNIGYLWEKELRDFLPLVNTTLRIPVPEDVLDVKAASSDGRAPAIEFPSLDACRKLFEKRLGMEISWRRTAAQSEFEA